MPLFFYGTNICGILPGSPFKIGFWKILRGLRGKLQLFSILSRNQKIHVYLKVPIVKCMGFFFHPVHMGLSPARQSFGVFHDETFHTQNFNYFSDDLFILAKYVLHCVSEQFELQFPPIFSTFEKVLVFLKRK